MIKTKPDEFVKFHKTLMSNAPSGYVPWYFPVIKHNKAPDGLDIAKKAPKHEKTKGNWKAQWAFLTYENAINRLKCGLNVGLAARANDPLIIIDIDLFAYTEKMPITLIVQSRKRCGLHGFCWKNPMCKILPCNIPTEYGEIRSMDQYVVVAGSYCETSRNDIEKENAPQEVKEKIKKDPMLGVYTVLKLMPPSMISYEQLPDFFKYQKEATKNTIKQKTEPLQFKGKHSALFDLKMSDIFPVAPKKRSPHPLHASDTGMNFSVDKNLAHCWRHLVSLNPIQYLCVKAKYMTCLDAGTGHDGSGAGESKVKNDYGAIFWAWYQAKKDGLISEDDPLPLKARRYLVYKHDLVNINNPYIIKKIDQILKTEY